MNISQRSKLLKVQHILVFISAPLARLSYRHHFIIIHPFHQPLTKLMPLSSLNAERQWMEESYIVPPAKVGIKKTPETPKNSTWYNLMASMTTGIARHARPKKSLCRRVFKTRTITDCFRTVVNVWVTVLVKHWHQRGGWSMMPWRQTPSVTLPIICTDETDVKEFDR